MIADLALGVDLGTTGLKAVALDRSGRVVAAAAAEHPALEHAGRVEADTAAWSASFASAVGRLGVDPSRLGAVGLSGNMSSVVLVDRGLAAVGPAILLADQRGARELAELDPGLRERIATEGGNDPLTVFALGALLWLRDRGELHDRRYLAAKDWLRAELVGVAGAEPTDAANSLLLIAGEQGAAWNLPLADALGLPRTLLPPLGAADDPAGVLTERAARRTGLVAGTPVAHGAGDVAAALLGGGGLAPRELAVSLGTSATLMAGLRSEDAGSLPAGFTRHPDAEGGEFALGSLITGGLALNWLRRLVGPEAIRRASDLPAAGGDLVLLPHLAGTGSPDFAASARGTVFGIDPSTRPEDLASALLHAIAFELGDLVEALDGSASRRDRLVLSGGGSRVDAWPQVVADVLGVAVRVLDTPDLSAVGAALLAWRAVGVRAPAPTSGRDVLPRAELRDAWHRRRGIYRRARADSVRHYRTSISTTIAGGTEA